MPVSRRAQLHVSIALACAVAATGVIGSATMAAPDVSSESRALPVDRFGPARTILLKAEVFHVQGVDLDADFIYVTSLNKKTHRGYLHKFTRAGDLVRMVELTDGPRHHPGGISLDGDSLWVPVAEAHSGSTARIVELDKTTLAVQSSFLVKDHIGAVAAHGGRLYGANYRAKSFQVWDRAGRVLSAPASPTQVHYQDMKIVDGELVASGLMPDGQSGAIDWLDPETLAPHRRLTLGKMDNGLLWTQEGMALQGNTLYLMPNVGSSRVDLQACKLEYSIVSPK